MCCCTIFQVRWWVREVREVREVSPPSSLPSPGPASTGRVSLRLPAQATADHLPVLQERELPACMAVHSNGEA